MCALVNLELGVSLELGCWILALGEGPEDLFEAPSRSGLAISKLIFEDIRRRALRCF